ncbi:hypothetical protein U1Q18_025812, partial [Sarracenia purpurea var. burkii]
MFWSIAHVGKDDNSIPVAKHITPTPPTLVQEFPILFAVPDQPRHIAAQDGPNDAEPAQPNDQEHADPLADHPVPSE